MLTSSLKLIGVTPVITGIRPENAVAMHSLGMDFKEIQTFGSLKQVLHIYGVNLK